MTINVTVFKATCLALIERVHRGGETVTITKHGRVVARLVGAVETDDKPWLALRGQAVLKGDPFAPAISDDDIQALK
jgi:prevent-host-death family protein